VDLHIETLRGNEIVCQLVHESTWLYAQPASMVLIKEGRFPARKDNEDIKFFNRTTTHRMPTH
jgi:hypothetical protein